MRSLAAADDAEAKSKLAELTKHQENQLKGDNAAVAGLLKFERELPRLFRDKFEFFGVIEFDEITRLATDRNRCAHPTFLHSEEPYHPTAEVARLHIRNAIDLVLTQEPTQGKAALRALRGIITSDYFPKERDEVKNRLEASPLKNGRVGLIRAFIDEAVFGIVTKGHVYYAKFSAFKALEAILLIHPRIAFPRMRNNLDKLLQSPDEMAVKYGAIMALRSAEVANALSDASKPALRAFMKKPSGTAKVHVLDWALHINWLKADAAEEVNKLSSDEIKKNNRTPAKEIVDRAAHLIASVKNYDDANKVINDILKTAKYMSEDNIKKIFESSKNGSADLKGSFGFDEFIQVLGAGNPIGKEKLQSLLVEYEIDEPIWADPASL